MRKRGKIFDARIFEGGKQVVIGYFKTALEAALAYDRWCHRLHGDRPNERLGLLKELSDGQATLES